MTRIVIADRSAFWGGHLVYFYTDDVISRSTTLAQLDELSKVFGTVLGQYGRPVEQPHIFAWLDGTGIEVQLASRTPPSARDILAVVRKSVRLKKIFKQIGISL